MKLKNSICAVVVTYNRKELLIECLGGLLRQSRPLDAVLIIDNASTDGTPELLVEKGYIDTMPPLNANDIYELTSNLEINEYPDTCDAEQGFETLENESLKIKIHYIRMHENTGGAGGFHEGVKRGNALGYDWLWLMDDDVEPVNDGLIKILKYTDFSGCILPSRKYINGEIVEWHTDICTLDGYSRIYKENRTLNHKQWVSTNTTCFEGLLLKSDLVDDVGLPEKKFFIWGDDTLYGYMLSKITNVIYVNDVALIKKIDKRGSGMSALAVYLETRNRHVYIGSKVSRCKIIYFSRLAYTTLKFIVKNTLLRRFDLIKAFLLGLKDGFSNKWGNEKRFLK